MYEEVIDGGIWGWLRRTRWNPPPATARNHKRRRTYVAALEQTEQLFHAASAVGPPVRPLVLFYGLSQAGRAIAAAASVITKGDGWRLEGHGIGQVKDSLRAPLPEVRVTTQPPGKTSSFVRLSELLDSPLWGNEPLPLDTLWDCIPENRLSPLEDTGTARRTPLEARPHLMHGQPHRLVSVPVTGFPAWLTEAEHPRQALDDYLASYPRAAACHTYTKVGMYPDSAPEFVQETPGRYSLQMHWLLPGDELSDHATQLKHLESITRPYKGDRLFLPVLGGSTKTMHPLMVWWAVLHTLSMLARYQPAEWGACIDVDRSPYAVPVEEFLKSAMLTLPHLIAHTIEEVRDGEVAGP